MVRNIPALALIPLVILWFGIDESAKLFLISVSVFFPIYLNTFHGIRNVDPGLIEMGRTYGLSRWQLYRQIILPGALSSILVGLRFSLGLMWVILIVAETISAQAGIGYLTMNAREFLQTDIVLVGILLYALLGKLADVFAKGLERYWLRWHPGYAAPERCGFPLLSTLPKGRGTTPARRGRWRPRRPLRGVPAWGAPNASLAPILTFFIAASACYISAGGHFDSIIHLHNPKACAWKCVAWTSATAHALCSKRPTW